MFKLKLMCCVPTEVFCPVFQTLFELVQVVQALIDNNFSCLSSLQSTGRRHLALRQVHERQEKRSVPTSR